MPDPVSLIFEDDRPAEAPGVHAVVIGVGHYRHLPGGSGVRCPDHENMQQLASPPHSARHVADWLFQTYYDDPVRPLRSLHLLISEPAGPADYAYVLCPQVTVQEAALENIRAAVQDWKNRGDASPESLMVLYFCGHGVSSGLQHSLLCTDYGEDHGNPLRHAIDFTQFHQGMGKCRAGSQMFLIDACRILSQSLLESGSKGDPLIASRASVMQRSAPIFRSALPGVAAYGLPGKPSAFAQALPLAFRGGAWREHEGSWVVCSSMLKLALELQITRVMREFRKYSTLIDRDNDVTMTLKEPAGQPLVPVDLGCRPDLANERAVLSYGASGANVIRRREVPEKEIWLLDLECGLYDFTATFANGEHPDGVVSNKYVHPPNVSPRITVG